MYVVDPALKVSPGICPGSNRLLNEGLALGNVLLKLRQAGLKEGLLLSRELTERVDLGNTLGLEEQYQTVWIARSKENTYTELNVGREEVNALVLVERAPDESGGNNTLLALQATEQRVGELGTSVSHGEGSGSSTVLGLDDFITTVLDTVDNLAVDLTRNRLAWAILGEERDDGRTGVTTDDGDGCAVGVLVEDLTDESGGTDNVEGGDTEQTLGVENTGLFKGGGHDGDGGVDRVGDDEDVGFGSDTANGGGEVADDGGVGLEDDQRRQEAEWGWLTLKRSSRVI
jgi:hypothetical protein